MKNEKEPIIIKKALTLSVIVLMLTLSFFPMSPMENVKATSSGTVKYVNETVLDVPFSNYTQVYKHLWTGIMLSGEKVTNKTVDYNVTENAASLNTQNTSSGKFILGGFTPALEENINLDVKIPSYGFNNPSLCIKTSEIFLGITSYNNHYLLVVDYYDKNGTLHTSTTTTPIQSPIGYVHLTIAWHKNRTFHFSFSDSSNKSNVYFSGWNRTHQDYDYQVQETLLSPWVFMTWNVGPHGTNGIWYHVFIKNLKETIPVKESAVFADVPAKKYAALGFDAPYQSTIQNASPILKKYGAKATFFFIKGYEDAKWINVGVTNNMLSYGNENDTAGWSEKNMSSLLADGFEFGIHTDGGMNTYNLTERETLDSEFSYLKTIANKYGWNGGSFVWTSLGNNYAWPYNDFVWINHTSIGRKLWGHFASNQGYVGGEFQQNQENPAKRGCSWIGYTHRIGGPYSVDMSPENFSAFINTSVRHGVHPVGYFEYWSRYAAPEYVTGNLSYAGANTWAFNYNFRHFKVRNTINITIEISALSKYLNNPDNPKIVIQDSDGNSVPFMIINHTIRLDAHEGMTYHIIDNSIAAQTGRGVSVMVAAMAVMMLVGAVGGLSKSMKR